MEKLKYNAWLTKYFVKEDNGYWRSNYEYLVLKFPLSELSKYDNKWVKIEYTYYLNDKNDLLEYDESTNEAVGS